MSWSFTGALLVAAGVAALVPDTGLKRLDARPDGGTRGPRLASVDLLASLVAAAVVLALWPAPLGALIAMGAAGVACCTSHQLRTRERPDPQTGEQLPETLELLAACLEAGAPVRTATQVVADAVEAPTSKLLQRVDREFQVGRAAPDAWLALAGDHWWGSVARDLARAARSGLPMAQSLRGQASEVRRRREAERMNVARSVGVRAVVPLMACFLPAFVLVGVVPLILGLLRGFLG